MHKVTLRCPCVLLPERWTKHYSHPEEETKTQMRDIKTEDQLQNLKFKIFMFIKDDDSFSTFSDGVWRHLTVRI